MSKFKYDRENIIENIDDILIQGDLKTFQEAKEWYKNAHNIAKQWGEEYNLNVSIVCGITSAMSPMKSWPENLKITKEFLECENCKHFPNQVEKARNIIKLNRIKDNKELLLDAIEFELGGMKTCNFFFNIYQPENEDCVTIDSQMCQLMTSDFNYKTPTNKQYQFLSDIIIDVAKRENMIPNVLQSFLWLIFRKIKKEKLGDRVRLS